MKSLFAAIFCLGLTACAGGGVAQYQAEKPVLDIRQYLNGRLQAWGMFQGRDGRVEKRFQIVIDAAWQGDVGTLDEHFTWSDGSTSRRVFASCTVTWIVIALV